MKWDYHFLPIWHSRDRPSEEQPNQAQFRLPNCPKKREREQLIFPLATSQAQQPRSWFMGKWESQEAETLPALRWRDPWHWPSAMSVLLTGKDREGWLNCPHTEGSHQEKFKRSQPRRASYGHFHSELIKINIIHSTFWKPQIVNFTIYL